MRLNRLAPLCVRALLRRHGPEALVWRRRIAILGGAITVGLVALLFARAVDAAGEMFLHYAGRWWWAPLVATPLGFSLLVWLTRRFAPAAAGSGIPRSWRRRAIPIFHGRRARSADCGHHHL